MSEVEKIILAPQFEFSENTINEIAENPEVIILIR